MCVDSILHIDLKALTDEISHFSYKLDDEWFEAIGATQVNSGDLVCDVTVKKATTHFEVQIHTEGTVQVQCDRCLDMMAQPIETDNTLIVKFGEEYLEEDELVIVDENEGMLDASWFVYEFIVLNIPIQHSHDNGKCNAEMIKLLDKYTATRSDGRDDEETIDPRWSKLAELIKDN